MSKVIRLQPFMMMNNGKELFDFGIYVDGKQVYSSKETSNRKKRNEQMAEVTQLIQAIIAAEIEVKNA